MNALITKIENGIVWAKTENEFGDSPQMCRTNYMGIEGGVVYRARNYAERCFDYDMNTWQLAELKRIEFPLDACNYSMHPFREVFIYKNCNVSNDFIHIGDQIHVEIKDGKFKII